MPLSRRRRTTQRIRAAHQGANTTASVNQLTFFPSFFEVGWVGSEAEAAGQLALEPPAVDFAQPSAGREGQHLPARSNS